MPRPRKCCYIAQPPAVAGMRPVGGDSVAPEAVTLRYDEYEAIRLIDHQGLTQAAAAERMGISRPTCTRLYDRARRTLAAALVEGRPLRIEGGKVCHSERWYRCPHCRRIHTGTLRCPACRRNEDSEILGQPNTTYNPVNTVIMEKIALPTRNGAVDDHFGHCECYTIFTLDADRRIAGRQTLPAAEGCGCKSDIAPPPARHGRRRDACRQHGRRGEKRPPTQRYRRHPRLPRACRGGRRSLSGRPDRRFGRRLRTPSRRRLSRTPRDDRLAPRRMTETGADGTIRNPSAAIFSRGRRYFSVKSRFLENSSYFCLAESSNGAAKLRCARMKRESGATPEQFPLL